jgi:hypothetical protein
MQKPENLGGNKAFDLALKLLTVYLRQMNICLVRGQKVFVI